jgi:DNA-binding CsgD family transcriptional regulator
VHVVGRDVANATLMAALDRVAAGRSAVVLVEGAAGMGKSTVIGRFLGTAGGSRTGRAAGVESEALVRYGVAASLLRELTGSGTVRPHDEVTQVGARLLAAMSAEPGPTVLVIDDAQWADAASLQALTFALRRLESDAVLTLIGTRAVHDSPEPLARLVEAARGETVRLLPLTVAEVAELAAGYGVPLSAAAARRLHTHTGGLPLYVVALLRELDAGELSRTVGQLPAPRSFAGLVRRRLAAAAPDVRGLVTGAAIVGGSVPLALATDLGQVNDVVAALDGAVGAGFVEHRRDPGGDVVRFSHDLVRAAVLDGMAPARRLALHQRAARLLQGVAALEQRAAAAVLPDGALSAELAKTARDEADSGATEQAVHHFLEASRVCPDAGAGRDLRLDAVETLLLSGQAAAARGLAADLRADLSGGDPARVGYIRGHLALLDGHPVEAERLLLDAWQWCEPELRSRLAALIAAQLSQLFTAAARNDETGTWARRVTRYAGDDARLATAATGALLASLVFSGRPDEAMEQALPESTTAAALRAGRFDDVVGRGLVRLWTDDLAGARADLAAVANPVGTGRPLRIRLLALAYLAEVEYRAGRWDDSMAASELAVSLAEDADHPWLRGLLHGVAALPLAGRGQWQEAATHVAAAQAASEAVDDVMNLVYPGVAACLLGVARRDHAAVLAATDPLAGLNPANGVLEPTVLQWCPYRVEALVATGALAEAEALLGLAEPLARKRGRRSALVALARARGSLQAARGDTEAATRAFEAGISLVPGLPLPFEAALLDLAYGSHLRRAGRRRAAADRLRVAVGAFDALGATPYAEHGRAELAAGGLTPRGRGPAQPTLTPREHAVARLLAEGLTNREIAERLVMSVKTAEYHLSNAYTKLGVNGRAQLAAMLAAGSAVPPPRGLRP